MSIYIDRHILKGIEIIDALTIGCLFNILFSMILLINAVLRLLFILLATPQTGVPISATGGEPARTLSAFDAVNLTSLVFILTAELIVLAFSLWLLFRVTRPAAVTADNP